MIIAIFAAALAAPPVNAPQPAASATVTLQDPVTCRSEVIVGSRLPVKVCSRPSSAEARTRNDRAVVEHIQGGAVTRNNSR